MHQDDPADAVLFQFKQRTERALARVDARLDRAEERADEVERATTGAKEEMALLRTDLARTHRVLLELQLEMRTLVKQVMARLDVLGGAREMSGE